MWPASPAQLVVEVANLLPAASRSPAPRQYWRRDVATQRRFYAQALVRTTTSLYRACKSQLVQGGSNHRSRIALSTILGNQEPCDPEWATQPHRKARNGRIRYHPRQPTP